MSVKIFSGSASKKLAKNVVKKYSDNKILNNISIKKFSDGEIKVHFGETVREKKIFIIQSTHPSSDNLIELFLMLDAAKRASARKICAVIPYFGYARQDRKDEPRVPISAKLMANLITASGADRVITIDLHVDQIQGFFDIPVDHLSSSYIFIPYLKNRFKTDDMIFASPDVGGSKRAIRYSNAFDTDLVLVHKERGKNGDIFKMKLIGDVEDKDVFFIDDIIDSAGTICKAANLVMDNGAKSVRALITHPILSGSAYDKINKSKLDELIVTDTIPIQHELSDKITILSTDELLAQAIKRIASGQSISRTIFGSM